MAVMTFTKGVTMQLLRALNPESWDYHIPGLNGLTMINQKKTHITYDMDNLVWKLNSQGEPVDVIRGKVDAIKYVKGGDPSFFMDDLNLNAKSLIRLMKKGDSDAIVDYVMRGDDTVTLSKYKDDFNGGRGDDVIRGMAGNDCIGGGDGADILWGNAGKDVFVFRTGDDKDRIMDFREGDRIDVSGIDAIKSWSDLKNNHLRQYNDHTVIDAGHGDKLVIEHTVANDLTADDFLF